jgi:hypothetical protein
LQPHDPLAVAAGAQQVDLADGAQQTLCSSVAQHEAAWEAVVEAGVGAVGLIGFFITASSRRECSDILLP